MKDFKLGEMETAFAFLIWENEPIPSGELVKLCEKQFNWKKSTTYTMLKRLCQRDIFKNEGGQVTSLISKEDFKSLQGNAFVEDNFGGSLPAFLTAFCKKNKLSQKDIAEIQSLIDSYKEE